MTSAIADALHWLAALLGSGGVWWSIGVSAFLAVGSLALGTAIVVGWSSDHFKRGKPVRFWDGRHPAIRALGLFAKNAAGVILVVVGLVMALPGIPGQGILTII